MKKLIKTFFVIAALLSSLAFTVVYIMDNSVADSYKVNKGEELNIDAFVPITAHYKGAKMSQESVVRSVGDSFDVDLKIFGVIPFSTVSVEVVDEMYVSVLGNPFGMKIYTDGVLVIEVSDVVTSSGTVNPASSADIRVGDYIKTANGYEITCNEDLSQVVLESDGSAMDFEIIREGKTIYTTVTPVIDKESGVWRLGIWVRDSSAGIGTLTFYSPTTGVVCGLGHGVCDSDTDVLLNINSGELVGAEIVSVEKGSAGNPGALKGKFTYDSIADISLNSENGVYGFLKQNVDTSNLTEIALKQEVYDGEAQILCTVDGDTPKLYSCTIKKRTSNYLSDTQNLVVTVTDEELISTTGGIVQGMSGSPILQDGKLVGALTHVLISDSHTGYGVFAENMLENAQSVGDSASTSRVKQAS